MFPVFGHMFEQVSDVKKLRKKLDYLSNGMSEISNVCKAVEGHYIQAKKKSYITMHHAIKIIIESF